MKILSPAEITCSCMRKIIPLSSAHSSLAQTHSESMAFHIFSNFFLSFLSKQILPCLPKHFFLQHTISFYNSIIYSHARTKIPSPVQISSWPIVPRSYHICQHIAFFLLPFHLLLPPLESHIKACQGPCLNKQGRLGTLIQSVISGNYCVSYMNCIDTVINCNVEWSEWK